MVLVLNGVLQEDSPTDTRALYHQHPFYRDTAAQLLSIPNKVIGPVGLLYVQQREFAATIPHDSKYTFLWHGCNCSSFLIILRRSKDYCIVKVLFTFPELAWELPGLNSSLNLNLNLNIWFFFSFSRSFIIFIDILKIFRNGCILIPFSSFSVSLWRFSCFSSPNYVLM